MMSGRFETALGSLSGAVSRGRTTAGLNKAQQSGNGRVTANEIERDTSYKVRNAV